MVSWSEKSCPQCKCIYHLESTSCNSEFSHSPRISGTQNLECTEPYKAILGVGFPLHKPYIKLIYVSTSILGTWKCLVIPPKLKALVYSSMALPSSPFQNSLLGSARNRRFDTYRPWGGERWQTNTGTKWDMLKPRKKNYFNYTSWRFFISTSTNIVAISSMDVFLFVGIAIILQW